MYLVARLFRMITVREDRNYIRIYNLPLKDLQKALERQYGSWRQAILLFTPAGHNKFTLPKFFAPELAFICKEISEGDKNPWMIRNLFARLLTAVEKNTWYKNTLVTPKKPLIDKKFLMGIRWQLKDHQDKFLDFYGVRLQQYALYGMLLASAPGTGKTLMDLCAAACIVPRSLAEIKIIISPKNALRLVWEDTIKKIFKKQPTYWVSDQPGDAPIGAEYYIFNYEALDRAVKLFQYFRSKKIKCFIIIDECHNFNDSKSLRTKRLLQLFPHDWIPYSVWASGSPIKALGIEIITYLKGTDLLFTAEAEKIFNKAFTLSTEFAHRLLYNRIGLVSFKVPKSLVMDMTRFVPHKIMVKIPNPEPFYITTIQKDMSDYIEQAIAGYRKTMKDYMEFFAECMKYHKSTRSWSQMRDYNKYMKAVASIRKASQAGSMADPTDASFAKTYEKYVLIPSLPRDVRKKFKDARSVVKNLSQKVQGEALGRVYAKRREECSVAMIPYINLPKVVNEAEGKTLIFSSYVSVVKETFKYMEGLGYDARAVYADTNKDLSKIIQKFTEDPNVNPAIASVMSLSTAVPVIAANTIVNIDQPYRQYLWDQIISRAFRMGQKRIVHSYDCILDTGDIPNISSHSDAIITWSRTNVAATMGGEFGGPQLDDFLITESTELPTESVREDPKMDKALFG